MFGILWPLVWYEIKRNLRPPVALSLFGFCMVVIWWHEEIQVLLPIEQRQVQGALTWHGEWLGMVIPVISGVVGSSVADEQRRGITLAMLARGVPRSGYMLSKILGAVASGALIMAAAIAGFYALVGIYWPAGRTTWHADATSPGPAPALYAVSPLANDLLMAAMSIVASGAMSAVGILTGTLTTNRYVTMAAPTLLFILTWVLHSHGIAGQMNTYTYLNLTGYYAIHISPPMRPYAAFVYWLCFVALLAALSRWIFARKELT